LWTDPDEDDMIEECFNDIYDFDNIQLEEIETIIKEAKARKHQGLTMQIWNCINTLHQG
jgi:hypothetical protein